MFTLRRVLLATGFIAATLCAAPPAATALGERVPQPILLSNTNLSWVEGQNRWISLSWTSQESIQDIKVTVSPKGNDIAVEYEDPSLGYAGLARGDDLEPNEIDATTFFLDPGDSARASFELDLLVDWTYQGQQHSGTITLRIEQESAGDEPFLLLTHEARVPAGGDGARNWVSVSFLGLRPRIGDFVVSVEGELPIYYPQRSFTSLHHDATLLEDERDVARFWLDPSTIEPGNYELEIVVTYTIGDTPAQKTRLPLHVLVD